MTTGLAIGVHEQGAGNRVAAIECRPYGRILAGAAGCCRDAGKFHVIRGVSKTAVTDGARGIFNQVDHVFGAMHVERSLAEIGRVLRPDGQFLLMVVNPDSWTRVAFPFFMHHGYFGGSTNHERWRSQLQNAGFEIIEQGTTPGTLYLLAKKG